MIYICLKNEKISKYAVGKWIDGKSVCPSLKR